MEVKPTFFSVSGFLAPGIVLLGSLALLLGVHYRDSLPAIAQHLSQLPKDGMVPVVLGALIVAVLLAVTFALGAVLSDSFTFIGRTLVLRPLVRSRLRKNVSRLFAHQTLEELIRADMDARESYVYNQTCGLDLHWYAGRVRMMGSTGLALLIAAVVACALGFPFSVVAGHAAVGLWAISIALYRSHKFDEYVSAASAAIVRGESNSRAAGNKEV